MEHGQENDGGTTPDMDVDEDAVQRELEAYTYDRKMSQGLRERLIGETDAERLNDDMRQGHSDSLLYLAWLRS